MKEKGADKISEHEPDIEKEKERERPSRREHDRERRDVSNTLHVFLSYGLKLRSLTFEELDLPRLNLCLCIEHIK